MAENAISILEGAAKPGVSMPFRAISPQYGGDALVAVNFRVFGKPPVSGELLGSKAFPS